MKAAVYTGTRNIYEYMLTSLKSLLKHSDVEKVYLLIEDDKFICELPPIVEVINVSGQTLFRQDGPNMKSRYTYMAMMRAALTEVLPDDLDVVLSLDTDTIVDRDISNIWYYPLGDEYYFAGAREWHRSTDFFMSTNAGVILHNLKKLRDGKSKEIIAYLNNHKLEWLDQDAMNLLCQGYIYNLPSEYNYCYYTNRCNIPKVIHHVNSTRTGKLKEFPDYIKYEKMTLDEIMKGRTK